MSPSSLESPLASAEVSASAPDRSGRSATLHRAASEDRERSGAPAVLRCSGTADLLAALPFLAGFTAENSLFVVLFSGKRSESALRIDLPPESRPDLVAPLVDGLCEMLEEMGSAAEGPAIVITSEQSFDEAGGVPWRGLARAIRRRFARNGWRLRDLAVVAPDGWAALLDRAAPTRIRPLDEITASPVTAHAVEFGGTPARLDELGRLPEPDAERAAAVLARLAELDVREERREAERAGAGSEPASLGAPIWLHGTARLAGVCLDQAEGSPPLEPRLCARLIRAAECSDRWLILALTSVTRAEFVIGLAEDAEPADFVDVPIDMDAARGRPHARRGYRAARWSIHALLSSLATEIPDPGKLRRAIAVLEDIAAHAPEPRRPGLLALLSWAWWMLGLQSVAARILDEALRIDPAHELSLMVSRLGETPPLWRFALGAASRAGGQR